MAKRHNEAATQFWEQFFAKMANAEDAAIVDVDHNAADDDRRYRAALAEAGWSEQEIEWRMGIHQDQLASAPVTSPGINPHAEFIFENHCNVIESAMDRLHLDSYARVARGIEPRVGPFAATTNVIMTNQSIVTVGAFLFRFCGLVARAFVRTLHLNPYFWEGTGYSEDAGKLRLVANPQLVAYWLRIYISFSTTGTHILVPFRPANRNELMVFEQLARAMEIFAIAHEYGHHNFAHGRDVESDPHLDEFQADQFALKIAYEVERKPLIFINPYLSSGAGGVVLLMALDILRAIKEIITKEKTQFPKTHPTTEARLAQFDTVAVLKPSEFAALKNFRMVSARVMKAVEAQLLNLLRVAPRERLDRLNTLSQ